MLAKGRLLGIQFLTLFTNDLFFTAAAHANAMAMHIKQGFTDSGIPFLTDSVTNQQFPILSENEIAQLGQQFLFERNQKIDENHTAVRFCTSWATKEEHVVLLLEAVKNICASNTPR